MTRTLAAALALALGLSVLSACSDDAAVPAPTIGDESSVEATPSESVTESPAEPAPVEETFDEKGHVAVLGDVPDGSPAQQTVVDAWIAYWQVRMDAFAVPEVDPAAIGTVAQGDAASQIVSYVDYLRQKKLRTEGDLRFDVTRVRVNGNDAVLQTCVTNRSVDRYVSNGKEAEPLTPFYEFEGRLARVSDSWTVTRVIDTGSGPC